MATTPERLQLLLKYSFLFFALAVVVLAMSLLSGPRSVSFLIRALIIGAGFSVLTISYWRWKDDFPTPAVWLALSVVLLIGGFYWSKDQTFGVNAAGAIFWVLLGQFVSTAAVVFCAFFAASSYKLK
ncbi:MAG: hypothetical protein ABR501_05360 [Pyrinomonadaceae bacterium]